MLRLSFGNTYEEVKNPRRARTNKDEYNSHRWGMFMTFNNDTNLTEKYIKSVTYHLVPGFRPRTIKVNKAPFILSRIGYGYFTVEFDIEFQPWTKLPKIEGMLHELSFEKKGETQNVMVEVDEGSDIENKYSLELAKKLAEELVKSKTEYEKWYEDY